MTAATGIKKRLAAASRRIRPADSAPPPVAPEVLNLAPDPGFRNFGAELYIHVHSAGQRVEVPGLPGVTGVRVTGRSENNDSHIAPDGRDAPAKLRLGLRPGGTYTASVSVFLPEPLTGWLNSGALRIIPGCRVGSVTNWTLAKSPPARNERGDHRISVTFTVPADAGAAWIRLQAGMSEGNGTVYWHSFVVTETDYPVDYFDGSTPDDVFHAYEWTGVPDASPSRRVTRVAEEASPAAIVAEAVRAASAGAAYEAHALLAEVPDDELAAARVALALGNTGAARKSLQKLAKADDPDGDAAHELGLLMLREGSWAPAESWLHKALSRHPASPARAYDLAFAYDKLKRRDDSKRTSAEGLVHDPGLPFDGPAVLDADVKCFGARREVAIFLTEHLDEIRAQAEYRLAHPVETTFDQPIFIYWAQGFDAAPPLVRACRDALVANNPGERVHELTDETIGAYVDVPEGVRVALGDNKTHFSDLLRLLLLEKFGGVWVDSTCFVSEPLRPRLDEVLGKGSVFAFNYHGPYISSWLLAARPGSYAMHLWRAAMFHWWEQRGELIDYFLLHHFFEMLYRLDPRFSAEWDEGVRLSSGPPHALQTAMLRPFDPVGFSSIRAGSFAHKLRYKYRPDELSSESYLARLLRGDLGTRARDDHAGELTGI
jgi:tetratricopeptide (TPR) repeat protein